MEGICLGQFVTNGKQTIVLTNTHIETMGEMLYVLQVMADNGVQSTIKFGTKQQVRTMLFAYRYSVSGENEAKLNQLFSGLSVNTVQ